MIVSKKFININAPDSGFVPSTTITNLLPDTMSVKVMIPRIDVTSGRELVPRIDRAGE